MSSRSETATHQPLVASAYRMRLTGDAAQHCGHYGSRRGTAMFREKTAMMHLDVILM